MTTTRRWTLRDRLDELRGSGGRADPRAAYREALAERTARYGTLRQSAAALLYARNKLAAAARRTREGVAGLEQQARRAVQGGDDAAALALLEQKSALAAELPRIDRDLETVRAEAAAATERLIRAGSEIRALQHERLVSLATLAGAEGAALTAERDLPGDDLERRTAEASARVELEAFKRGH